MQKKINSNRKVSSAMSTVVACFIMLWTSVSESEASSASFIYPPSERFREQKYNVGNVSPSFQQSGSVPYLSIGDFGKVPDTEDPILQSNTDLSRNFEAERKNIQPRKISGFSFFNFPLDSSALATPLHTNLAAPAVVATTSGPETTVQDPFSLSSSVTFSNLVERARQRNGPTLPTVDFSTTTTESTSTTTATAPTTTTESTSTTTSASTSTFGTISRSNSRYRGQQQQQTIFRSKKRLQPQQIIAAQQLIRKNSHRFLRRQRLRPTETTTTSTTAALAEATTTTTTVEEEEEEVTTQSTPVFSVPTTVAAPRIFTNFETASAFVVTRNVTSTSIVTPPPPVSTLVRLTKGENEDVEISTEPSTVATTAPSRKQRQNDESASPTYDYYSETTQSYYDYDEAETTQAPRPALLTTTTTVPATTRLLTLPRLEDLPKVVAITASTTTTTTTTTTEGTTSTEEVDTTLPMSTESTITVDRSPRTSDVDIWDKDGRQHIDTSKEDTEEPVDIFSGKYYEVNPGQYQEDDAGAYHEDNPGQYHEDNPGQYIDPHLEHGQYTEANPGQYKDAQLDIQVVEHKYTDDAQVYNVQSKVDNFIIGEYGTISKSDGQTIQGVRYTAVNDQSIDPKLIYETLRKFFPMSQQQQQQQEGLDYDDDEEGETRRKR